MSNVADIVVIGAGIAGISTAIAMRRQGYSVVVCERSAELGEVGAGIQLAPNATRVLHALGMAEPLAAIGTTPESGGVRMAGSGRYIIRPHRSLNTTGWPYYQCHRADLLSVLVQQAQALGVVFKLGMALQRVTQDAGGVNAWFASQQVVRGRVLVGADGVRSLVQQQLFGNDSPHFTGNVAWRGLVPVHLLRQRIEPSIFLGPGKHFVSYYVRNNSLVNFVAIEERDDWPHESWTQAGDMRQLRQGFSGWHDQVSELLDCADTCFQWALYSRKPLPAWSQGRVVLVGDACHPTLPNLAQGAGMAIEDAYVLAAVLKREEANIPHALNTFYQLRIKRCTAIQAASYRMAKLLHSPSGWVQFCKFAPAALLSRVYPALIARKVTWSHHYDATQQ